MERSKKLISSSQNILGFIPAIVVQQFIENRKKGIINRPLPDKQTLKSVVMFADISGFTKLTEKVSQIGQEGSEVIAFAINRYMELLAKAIGKTGGDIFKFAGDAIIVIWPPHPDLDTLCRQALSTALEIQGKLNDTNILQNVQLSVKIGFGVGEISIIYVGGVFNRSEYLAIGDPLIQAFNCEHHATGGGQTLISSEIYNMIGQNYNCERISDKCYLLKSLRFDKRNKHKVKMRSEATMITNNIPLTQFEEIKQQLITFIPAALIPYILIDQEKWSGELRILTVMFVNLGIDLSQINTQEGLNEIQEVVVTVQKSVYYFQGSLNKFLIDDKGSTLIVVFGFPPYSHQDDPIRAINTAQTLKKELKVSCSVGITTGCVYAGVVGTSGSRREYSIIGDNVNLAARLMQLACKHNNIFIDQQTAKEANQKMFIRFVQDMKFKGKDQEISIFEPVGDDELNKLKQEHWQQYLLNNLRVHNPFFPKFDKPSQMYFLQQNDDPTRIFKTIDQYLKGQITQAMIQVYGGYGSGKTFNVYLILNQIVKKIQQNEYKKWKYEENSLIFVSSLSPSDIGLQFNGVRKIVKQLVQAYQARTKDKNLLRKLDMGQNESDILDSILEISHESILLEFPGFQNPNKLLQKQFSNVVCQIMNLFTEDSDTTAPPIFCFDDFQYYDEGSLRVIKSLVKKTKRILMIMLVRDRSLDCVVKPDQLNLIESWLSDIENLIPDQHNYVYELNGFVHFQKNSQIKEFIHKEFKINDYTFESSNASKNLIGAILKQQSRRLIHRRTLGVKYILN